MLMRAQLRGMRRWSERKLGGAGSAGAVRGNSLVRRTDPLRMLCCFPMSEGGCRVLKGSYPICAVCPRYCRLRPRAAEAVERMWVAELPMC